MRTIAARALFGLVVVASPMLQAAIIPVFPVSVKTSDGVDVPFTPLTVNKIELVDPFRLNATERRLFFRWEVPSAAQIAHLNSLVVTLHVYDDDDPADEEGAFVFLLPIAGPDLYLSGFGGVFGALSSDPNTTYSGQPPCLCDALAAIQDNGKFRVRVNRDLGDFWVKQMDISIDAQLVPEPSSFALMGLGAVAIALRFRRRRSV
jgi:hypothetical protein